MALRKAALDDLILQLREFDNKRPDYILWLGAGASVSSGIPSASGIVSELLRRTYAQQENIVVHEASQASETEILQWASNTLKWFKTKDPYKSEYAQVMENVYPTPGMREQLLRRMLQRAQLSVGYRLLGLLLKRGVFDTVLTTNFDHLVRQGADPVLPQPIKEVNALDQYSELQPFPEEPRLVRLHGDFWHDNTLNTERELEDTPTIRFDAVKRLLHSYGLIVVGYGGWDRSVMDNLFSPLKNASHTLRKGLYWCHQKGVPLSPLVESFLSDAPDDRVFLVEIEDFESVISKFAGDVALDLPLEEELRKQLEAAWASQSLHADLVEALFSDTTVEQVQEHQKEMLLRLTKLVNNPQAILVCRRTNSEDWYVAAKVGISTDPSQVDLTKDLLALLMQGEKDYVLFSSEERSEDDPFYNVFADDRIIENFLIWQGGQLLGFVAFASVQPLIGQLYIPLIKSAVRLLVSLP